MRFTDIGKSTGTKCVFESTNEAKLLFNLIRRHINLMPKVYRKRNDNWAIVKQMTNNGCGYSIAICRALNVDPFSKKWEQEEAPLIITHTKKRIG